MIYLVTGLVIFFAIHAVNIIAPQWREAKIASMGEQKWRGLYSIVSAVGFILLIWGYSEARTDAPILFDPPSWAPHLASLLMAIALILLVAYMLPAGKIKQAIKHPFLAAVKFWALAHLVANGDLASLILFGSFLAYAVVGRISIKRRGGANPVAVSSTSDIISVVAGLGLTAVLIFGLHQWLFGVNPIA